ncbi:MAG TPA: FKBP-type peptidyl-prolyl cis-trans isomerase [Polyangia bacterium]
MKSPVAFLCFVAFLFSLGLANAKSPAKKERGKTLPTYEEVVKTYPEGVPLCATEADIVGGNDQQLSLGDGYIPSNADGEPRYQCYGTKLTVRKKVILKGKTYPPETKLTVDKDLYWIEVSGWEPSQHKSMSKPSPSAADPQKAPADVAGPPDSAEKAASGLASRVLRAGTGTVHPHRWDKVTVHYTGWMTNGKMFDSSVSRGEPATFQLDEVIAGWTEGVQWMVAGEVRRLWIPAKLAYGETARQPGGPSGMLVFDVELLDIIPGTRPLEPPSDVASPPKNASKTASGLAYVTLTKGSGKVHPYARDRVRVHYSGWTTDGKLFDSSVVRGEPTEFPLNGVIKGWTEGVQLMVVGDKTRFWIPGELAYGNSPSRQGVPSGMLVFDIELLQILPAESSQ